MLVGRSTELELLLELTRKPRAPMNALVVGPAGIGKSALCTELLARSREAGWTVASGRAWEFGGAPPFFPWIRVLTTLSELAPAAAASLGAIAARLQGGPDHGDAAARLHLFEASRRALSEAARTRPLLVTLDDLHAADPGSLQLFRYLQQELGDAPVVLLAATRPSEAEAPPETRALLADITRGALRTVHLAGLSITAVDEWLPWFCGEAVPAGLAARLVDLTGGNPYFLRELALAHRGGLASLVTAPPLLPDGVREVIRRQVARLDAAAQETLRVAAVFGREADLRAVAALRAASITTGGASAGSGVAWLLEGLRPAIEARLLSPSTDLEQLRFGHGLVREAVYADLSPERRLALHSAAVEVLPPSRLSERTRHAVEAEKLGAGRAAGAIELCLAAGGHALRALAFEEAATHFAAALWLGRRSGASPEVLADAALGHGEALAAAGEREAAAGAFGEAADLARSLGDAPRLARAALGRAATREYVQRDTVSLGLLQSALEALGPEPSDLGARLRARLATDLAMIPGSRGRRSGLASEALAMARGSGHTETIALALEARLQAVYGPDSLDERLATSDEILALARARGHADREIAGLGWKLSALLESGELALARPLAEEHGRLADRRRLPGPRINARSRLATLAFLAGRFEDGFRLAAEALQIGQQAQDEAPELLYQAQLALPGQLLGRAELLEAGIEVLARDGFDKLHAPAIRSLVARSLLALGRQDEARAQIRALASGGFAGVPDDFVRVGTLASLAEVAAALDDEPAAELLAPLLQPYATHNAMIGTATSSGAVTRALGLLALTTGRLDQAIALLTTARERNALMQARPWLAWTEHDLAVALRRSGRSLEAGPLLDSARATATALGLEPLGQALAALADDRRGPVPPAAPRQATDREGGLARPHQVDRVLARLERVVEGTTPGGWHLVLDGRTVTVGDRRGLGYLARLLGSPRQAIHALELVAGESGPPTVERGGDPVLDARARVEIRSHLATLRREQEAAEEAGDHATAERSRAQLEELEDHLVASLGLGGRSREHGSAAERARVAVTVAIRRAVVALRAVAPEVAEHLGRSVRTGRFCVYDPDPTSGWRVTM